MLIMYHYLMCYKLTFDLHRNNKLHVLNINYYKLIFHNFLKIHFEIKFLIFICTKTLFASYIIIHLQK